VKTNVQPQMLQTGRPASGLASPVANWYASLTQIAVAGIVFAVETGNRGAHGNGRGTARTMVRSGTTGATEMKRSISNKNCSKIVRGLMPQVAGG
jgi:hypothetical protein